MKYTSVSLKVDEMMVYHQNKHPWYCLCGQYTTPIQRYHMCCTLLYEGFDTLRGRRKVLDEPKRG